MSERLSDQNQSPELGTAELESAAAEHLRNLEQQAEQQSPEQQEQRAEAAREVIAQQAEVHHPATEAAPREPATPPPAGGLLNRALNYKHTLQSLQRQLRPASRQFSKVIHTPAVERTSEVLEATVLRPSVTLGATSTAFVIGAFTYLVARHYGYALSGSEIILSLLVGGLIGVILEFVFRLFRRRRS